ncbi:hypothetical protein BDR04DRAFT_1087199 [Suillus decipiens]|nr:hypothetical protein BDR04DRAFT_1087199 [Suillus decipiens]
MVRYSTVPCKVLKVLSWSRVGEIWRCTMDVVGSAALKDRERARWSVTCAPAVSA